MFNASLYALALIFLVVSYSKDKKKTKQALKKAWKSFENILPQFLAIIVSIGIMLSIIDAETITHFLGANSGILGTVGAAFVGAITLIPGFIAFPLAAALIDNGAGITQIAAFVSTLMMVGVLTIPLEVATFGKKVTFIRNGMAFIYSLLVAYIMGLVL